MAVECVSCGKKWSDEKEYCVFCGYRKVYGSPTRAAKDYLGTSIIVAVASAALLTYILVDILSHGEANHTVMVGGPKVPTNVPKIYDTEITAGELAADFEANEVRAEQNSKGKKYRVSGTITGIGKEILGKPYLIIDNKVRAVFEKGAEAAIARYDKGMQVTGNCEVGGKLVYVILQDCSL